jgi:hypothetical protein
VAVLKTADPRRSIGAKRHAPCPRCARVQFDAIERHPPSITADYEASKGRSEAFAAQKWYKKATQNVEKIDEFIQSAPHDLKVIGVSAYWRARSIYLTTREITCLSSPRHYSPTDLLISSDSGPF